MSVEGSVNSSFDGTDSEDQEWLEGSRENSLDDFLEEGLNGDEEMRQSMGRLRVTNPDATPDMSDNGIQDGSTTDRFVTSLMEEGMFSPALSSADGHNFAQAQVGATLMPTMPMERQRTPVPPESGARDHLDASERDSAGAPYGRTHHAERAIAHHRTRSTSFDHPPLAQPRLPQNDRGDSQPAISTSSGQASSARQDGQREEGQVPLGGTIIESGQLGKQMATHQSLGLGMPRGLASGPEIVELPQQPASQTGGRPSIQERLDKEMKRQSMPGPPRPQELDLPEPVSRSGPEEAPESVSKKVSQKTSIRTLGKRETGS